jgi:polar amino acid transport system substrate-binding protein
MRNTRSLSLVAASVVVALAAVVLAACGSSSTSNSAASASPSAGASSSAATFNIANVKADSTLTAMLPAAIKSAGTIHVATAMPYAPWEMYVSVGSKQATGIDYDLSMAIAARLGIKDSFDQTQFDAIIPSMLAGKEDMVMASMFDNPERQKQLDFVDYATDGYGLLVASGNPANIKTVDDLSGKTVAVQSSTSQVGELKKLNTKFAAAGKAPVTILQFPQDADSVLAVTSGKAQAQMDDQSVAAYNVKTVGGGQTLAFVNDPSVASSFSNAIVGAGIPKTDPQLRDAVQKALQSLIADGTYASILNKYGESTLAVTSAQLNQGK